MTDMEKNNLNDNTKDMLDFETMDNASPDYNDVAQYFQKVVDAETEKQRQEKELEKKERLEKERNENSTRPTYDNYNDVDYNSPIGTVEDSSPVTQPMTYVDVAAYFKQQVDNAEMQERAEKVQSNTYNSVNYDSYDTQNEDYKNQMYEVHNGTRPLDDGTAYRPILEEIISNSQRSSSADKLKAPKAAIKPSENIALMQNLESGLSILKAELKNQNYNLRPYTKFNSSVTYYENSHIFPARIRMEASIYTLLIMLVELFAAYFIVNAIYPQKLMYYYIGAGALGLVLLLVVAISLMLYGHKKINRYSFKTSTLTSLIIIFPAIVLIVLYALFIKKIQVNEIKSWIYLVIYPTIAVLNVLVYAIMYNIVFRTGRHNLK